MNISIIRRMLKFLTFSFFALVFGEFKVIAQETEEKVLGVVEFLKIVKTHHPMAIQAELQTLRGDLTLQGAKGGFDPKIMAEMSQKYYNGTQYYSLLDAGLKVPTRLGFDINAGYEQNGGNYLNPEDVNPSGGLVYTGISVPIGQGLFIDERRAVLRQAKIYRESTATSREMMLNDLLLEAGKAYWQWFQAYHTLEVYEEALALANERFEAVKNGAINGDRPNIDTLESGIQVQNRKLGYQQAQLDYMNAGAWLSVYLWADGQLPLEIGESTIPSGFGEVIESSNLLSGNLPWDSLVNMHPELRNYQFGIEQYQVQRDLKKEQIKPTLNLKYNAISEPVGSDIYANYSLSNYTWGFDFGMPIFLRKERGNLKLAQVKITEAEMALKSKELVIVNKAKLYFNEYQVTNDQIELYRKTVEDYSGLLEGERSMFDSGESSLFMVNSRELGYINAKIKLISLFAKNQKAGLQTHYSFGILHKLDL